MFQQINAFAHVFDPSSSHNLLWFKCTSLLNVQRKLPPPAAWVNRVHAWGMYIYQKTPHQPPYTWPKIKGYTLR